ncbi:MAG: hypothetical protein JNJ58_08360 [Chitinophagaceae bacterium]|nr:hypothetical protein [Chitinophagaceae bacterium]
MKKILILGLISMTIITMNNCSPKTAKKTTTAAEPAKPAERPAPKPVVNNTPPANTNNAKPWEGKTTEEQVKMYSAMSDQRKDMGGTIYKTNCGKCHKLYEPGSRNMEEWLKIMPKMGQNAKLSDTDYMMLCSWLTQNAKK